MDEEVKVSELTEASIINNEDLLMTVQNNVNKKVSFSKVLSRVEPIINDKLMLATYGDSYIDPNTTLEPLILTRHSNGPSTNLNYIQTKFYNTISTTSSRMQTAIGYNLNKVYERYYANNSWSNWIELTQSEGTWTPTLTVTSGTAPTVTYTSRKGRYKKQGNLVFIDFYIRGRVTALGTGTNYGMITGLPYSGREVSMGETGLCLGIAYNLSDITSNYTLVFYNGTVRLQYNNGASTIALKLSGDTDFQFGGSGWYEIE